MSFQLTKKEIISEIHKCGKDPVYFTNNYAKISHPMKGLIPFKMLGFESGVNFTAGLSLVRTSPDHGTAFDIAAVHSADHGSFRAALYLGRQIAMHRQLEKELKTNPLQQQAKRSGRDS